MPDYSKACIYKIKHNEDYNDENIYIGSTCNLIRRRCMHKTTCYNENNKLYNSLIYQYIRDNGGWDCFVMIKIHDFPCESKGELEIEERRMIDLLQSKLNKNVPGRMKQEYVICECGCKVQTCRIYKHKKTNKHQDLMAKI